MNRGLMLGLSDRIANHLDQGGQQNSVFSLKSRKSEEYGNTTKKFEKDFIIFIPCITEPKQLLMH